jgi:hypothetical protein
MLLGFIIVCPTPIDVLMIAWEFYLRNCWNIMTCKYPYDVADG